MRNTQTRRTARSRRLHLESLEGRRLLAVVGPQTASDTETALVSESESVSLSTQKNDKGNGKGNGKPSGAAISVSPIDPTSQGLLTSEIGGTAAFEVVLDSRPTADVTIDVESSDTSEGTISVNTLTFTPADWDVSQSVVVTGVQDPDPDGAVDYQIILDAAVSADPDYDGLDPDDVSLSNLDDDSQTTYVGDFEILTRERGKFLEVQFVVDVRIDSQNFGVADEGDAVAVGAVVVVSVYDSDPTDLNGLTNIRNFVGTTNDAGTYRTEWYRLDPDALRVEVHDVLLTGYLWDPADVLEMSFDDDDEDGRPDFLLTGLV